MLNLSVMKQPLLFIVFLFSFAIYGQTTGINYQSVILRPKEKTLPGVEISSLPLVNTSVCMRFTIFDSANSIEYQEMVSAKTDDFGIVNTIIGSGTKTGGYSNNFSSILWSSLNKKLVVELDITNTCSSFEEISNQAFAFSPYANHALTASSVTGIVEIVKGGTGATTVLGAKTNLGLNNVDNTSDLNKPISIAVQSGLDTKENSSNKISDISLDPLSTVKYPSVVAVKNYVESKVVAATPDATTIVKGKIQLVGDLSGTASNPTVPGLALKEDASNKSLNVTNDGASDTKYPSVKAVKIYIDNAIGGVTTGSIVDADTDTKGKIQLAGDLTGTATAPVVKDATTTLKGKIRLSGDLTGTADAPFINPGAGGIYRGSGSLIANTTVSMNSNTLSFNDGNITVGTNATVPFRHTIGIGSDSTIWFPGFTAIKTNNNAFDTSIGFISNMAFNSNSWVLAQDSKPGWMLNVSSFEDRFSIRRISAFDSNLSEILSLSASGHLLIQGGGLSMLGWNTVSDRRLKNTIHDTRYSIDDLLKIKVRDYYLNSSPTILSNGFIAQELFEVYPDAVFKGTDELDADGKPKQYWSVDYGKLTPLLTKAIQEQQQLIQQQQQQIDELQSQIQKILTLITK